MYKNLIAQAGEPVEYPAKTPGLPYVVEGSLMASLVVLLLFNIAFPAIKAFMSGNANESRRVDTMIQWQQQYSDSLLKKIEADSELLRQVSELVKAATHEVEQLSTIGQAQREQILSLSQIVKELAEEVKDLAKRQSRMLP